VSVPLASSRGRGILLASIVGSGMAFLDGTVVNVALPALGRSLGADLAGLQWTLDAYLVTLCAFLLTGGSLGDRLGRRLMFELGAVGFAGASLLCGLAPSLSLVRADIDEKDQGTALGLWTGLSGVTSALGPLVGGWLVETVSWRAIFFLNLPLAVVAVWAAHRCLPGETRTREEKPLDLPGAAAGVVAIGGLTFALIEGPAHGWGPGPLAAAALGAVAFGVFLQLERRPDAMMPLALFRHPVFSATNGVTLLLYSALGCAIFLLMLELQIGVGLSPVQAGLTLLPATVLMLLISPRTGRWGKERGGRWPMALGAAIAGGGFVCFLLLLPGAVWTVALPGTVLLGLGLSLAVAPLTVVVLDSVRPERAGIAAGVNNAVARLAGLLGVAAVPWAAGLSGLGQQLDPMALTQGFHRAMLICAGLCVAASVASVIWVPSRAGNAALPAPV